MSNDNFPDKKEVDATRRWYYGVGYEILSLLFVAALLIATALWLFLGG